MNVDGGKQVKFSRELNLLIESDLETFVKESVSAGYRLPVSNKKKLREIIGFGRQFFTDSAFYVRNGTVQIYVYLNGTISYDFFKEILPLASFLYKFRDNNDFINKIKNNISNLKQFDDTIFELKCLRQFNENGCNFIYEPNVIIKDKTKKPDFKITKDNISIFVECKQIGVGKRVSEINFINQVRYAKDRFAKGLHQQLHENNLRLEIYFKKTPSIKDLETLIAKINAVYSNNNCVGEKNLQKVNENIEFIINRQDQPSQFPKTALTSVTLRAGIEERMILNSSTNIPIGEILFKSSSSVWRKGQTIIKRIREAKNQLPIGKHGIIILGNANIKIVRQEIEKRMNGNQYTNIIAFVANPFEHFWSCYRTPFKDLLLDLFKGFQS